MEKLKIPDTAHCKPWLGTLQKGVYTFGLKKKNTLHLATVFLRSKQKKRKNKQNKNDLQTVQTLDYHAFCHMSEDHSNSSPILQHNNNFQTPSPNITSVIWAIFHAGTGTWASLGSTVWGPHLSHGTLHNWCGVVLFKNKIRFPMKVFSGKEHCGLPTKSPQRDSKGKIALGLT